MLDASARATHISIRHRGVHCFGDELVRAMRGELVLRQVSFLTLLLLPRPGYAPPELVYVPKLGRTEYAGRRNCCWLRWASRQANTR